MTTHSRHVPTALLERYATVPEVMDPTTADSLEQHLLHCSHCRHTVARATPVEHVDALWAEIADAVDRRAPTRIGRVFAAIGVERPAIRLVAATRSLQGQAVMATAAVAVGALWVARVAQTSALFLVLAPLVILAVVACAFWPTMEPGGEISPSTPLYGFSLFMRRAIVVLVATIGPLAAASLLLPGTGLAPFAWVLPALALSFIALALSTRVPSSTAAAILATGWLGVIGMHRLLEAGVAPPTTLLTAPGLQALAALAVVVSLAIIVHRRDTFDQVLVPTGGVLRS